MKTDLNVPSKSNKQKNLKKQNFFWLGSCPPLTTKKSIRIRKSEERVHGSGSVPKYQGYTTLLQSSGWLPQGKIATGYRVSNPPCLGSCPACCPSSWSPGSWRSPTCGAAASQGCTSIFSKHIEDDPKSAAFYCGISLPLTVPLYITLQNCTVQYVV
jgi:hypothetical protein